MPDYVNPGVVAGIGFQNFFRQQEADRVASAQQELEAHVNALKLQKEQMDVQNAQEDRAQKKVLQQQAQLLPGDIPDASLLDASAKVGLPLPTKVLPGDPDAQGPVQPGQEPLSAPTRIYLGTPQQRLAQQKAEADKAAADAKQQAMQAILSEPDPQKRALLAGQAGLNPNDIKNLVGLAPKPDVPPPDEPIFRISPTTGKVEQIGTAPKGSHFVNEPKPVVINTGASGPAADAGLDALVDRYMAGDTSVVQLLGTGQSGTARKEKFAELYAKKLQSSGLTSGDTLKNTAALKANVKSYVDQQEQADAIQSFANTADANIPLLSEVIAKIPSTGFKGLNGLARAASRQLGSQDMAQFDSALNSLRSEYARLTTQPNLKGVLTVEAQKSFKEALDDASDKDALLRSLETLRREGHNRLLASKQQINTIGNRISGKTDSTTTPSTATPEDLWKKYTSGAK